MGGRLPRRIAAGIALLLLAACAAVPPPRPFPSLTSVPTAFEMTGRLAVRQGQTSDIAQLRWTRTAAGDVWVIASPLGNEVARIESTPRGAVLHSAGNDAEEAPSFQALTQRLLGVALDPAWLAQGLHGQAPEGLPAGWTFHIDETEPAGAVQIAKRITVRGNDTVVRLVVDSYEPIGS